MLSLVRRKVWNHYFSVSNKAGNYQPFWHNPLSPKYTMNANSVRANACYHNAGRAGVSGSHSPWDYTSIHWQLSQTPIIKHKHSVMLISRPTCMLRGFPSSQNSWLPFVLVSSSYSSLSFDYTAIRYANTWDPEKYFFKHQIVSNQAHSLLLYTQATHLTAIV